jgi:hypothetical protein
MPRKRGDDCTFRQRDVKELIKAARNAGVDVNKCRLQLDKSGTISLVPMALDDPAGPEEEQNPWSNLKKLAGK